MIIHQMHSIHDYENGTLKQNLSPASKKEFKYNTFSNCSFNNNNNNNNIFLLYFFLYLLIYLSSSYFLFLL